MAAPIRGIEGVLIAEADERITYLVTAEGRRFVEEILRLSPKLRTRMIAVIRALAGADER
ncbi:hypothetical protein [Rhizobium sp. A37_96]